MRLTRRDISTGILASMGFFASPTAYAHRQKRALSKLVWNDRTKTLEVSHILHLYDTEIALAQLGILEEPDLEPLKARARLALYVSKHFKLQKLNENNIPLEIVGAEIVDSHVYVYQEVALPSEPSGFIVIDTILQRIYLNQTNLVSLNIHGNVSSVTFSAGDSAKKLLA